MNRILDNFIIRNKWQKYCTKEYFNYFVISIFGLLGLFLGWGLKEVLGLLILIWLFLNPVKGRVLLQVTMAVTVLMVLMLIGRQESRAEMLAIITYGLIILTVCTLVYESRKEDKVLNEVKDINRIDY